MRLAAYPVLGLVLAFTLFACERPGTAPAPAPAPPSSPQANSVSSGAPKLESQTGSEGQIQESRREVAVLAGGCFWGMEDILRDIDGVLETEVGYAGGRLEAPSYEDVKKGDTGHAESVRIVFDPRQLSFEELLLKWFFRMHDPTTRNRQGNDVGTQYRSAIFFTSPEQKSVAERVIRKVNESGQWSEPVVTELSPAGDFNPAESYHQDYLEKNPGGYTCHYLREPVY